MSPSPSSFREATPYDNGGRRSAKEKPSLRAARKGISDAIHGLHTLKTQTRDLVHDDFSATTISLNRVQALRVKKTKLEDTIRGLEASPDRRELEDLGKEDEVLGEKISGMEMQLEELRARQRSVRVKVQEGWNREEARLSSYRGTLEILGREEGEVLARAPAAAGLRSLGRGEAEGEGGGGRESVWDLPVKRRTLGMVEEFYGSEREAFRGRLDEIEIETRALEEGGGVWEDVVREVGGVERLLGREMRALAESDDGVGDDDGKGEERRTEGMKRVLDAMAGARVKVQGKLKMAEEKGWKLLIVCVGAELEALLEGEQVLRGVMGTERAVGEEDLDVYNREGGNGDGGKEIGGGTGSEDVRELGPTMGKRLIEDTDDDEEPGPELMLSRQEDETGGLGI